MRSAAIVAPARNPKPPALVVAATRFEPAAAHRRLHDGVAAAEQVAKRRAQGHLGGQVFFSRVAAGRLRLVAGHHAARIPPSVPAPSSWLCVWAKWW